MNKTRHQVVELRMVSKAPVEDGLIEDDYGGSVELAEEAAKELVVDMLEEHRIHIDFEYELSVTLGAIEEAEPEFKHGDKVRITDVDCIEFGRFFFENGDIVMVKRDEETEDDVHLWAEGLGTFGLYISCREYGAIELVEEE